MATWLDDRDYRWEFEPGDWGVNTCPDFRVEVFGQKLAIEVESIESWGGFKTIKPGQPPFSRTMDRALEPVRSKIRKGARQLKPLAGTGMPLLVAVVNPYNRPVPYSADMMISAMYGDPTYTFPADGGPGRATLGRNGKLTNDHPYLSGVLVLRSGPGVKEAVSTWFDQNRTRFDRIEDVVAEVGRLETLGYFGDRAAVAVDVLETVTAPVRVPADFAGGPHDTHWAPLEDGTGIVRLR